MEPKKTRTGSGHLWARYKPSNIVQCVHCGVRIHWPMALRLCKARAVYSPKKLRILLPPDVYRLSPDELQNEVQRAYDLSTNEDNLFTCHSPNLLVGRDGRRRTGI
jgi:hypothetical protein